MNPQGQTPRSRGAICGVLLILLGLWGGLAPFVGPYFHFGYTPDKTLYYSSGRLYFSVIPGAAALLGGLVVLATRNRGVGTFGGVLAALGGAWFVAGLAFVTYVLKKSIAVGVPITTASTASAAPLRTYLEQIALFTGIGLVILFVGALAVGRFSMVSARDVAPADASGYYADSAIAGQYSTSASSYPTSAAQFPAGGSFTPSAQYPDTTGQYPDAPTQYPETTTSQFPPRDSGS